VRLPLLLAALTALSPVQPTPRKLNPVPDPKDTKVAAAHSHALVIGINRYPNLPEVLQLSYATKDADSMAFILKNSYGFDDVQVLEDGTATLERIKSALALLTDNERVHPDDHVLVYFSGHGQTVSMPTGGEMGFFIPSDAKVDLKNIDNAAPYLRTCLSMVDVGTTLGLCPARQVLVVADACFSGGMIPASRGLSTQEAQAMLKLQCRMAITAGSKGEETQESSNLGHGIFTYKLLELLKSRSDGDIFSALPLHALLAESVPTASGNRQHPKAGWLDPSATGDFVFAPHGDYGRGGLGGAIEPKPTLRKVMGSLTVHCPVSQAQISVDGQVVGTGSYTGEVELSGGLVGVRLRVPTDAEKKEQHLPTGVFVDVVMAGLPADLAGLQKGDLLMAFGATALDSTKTFTDLIKATAPGRTSSLTLLRGGQVKVVQLTPARGRSVKVQVSAPGYKRLSWDVFLVDARSSVTIDADLKPDIPARWNYAAMTCSQVLDTQAGPVSCVAFSSNGTLAGGNSGADSSIRIWDPDSGALLQTVKGHTGGVEVITFSSDGSRMVSAGADETIKFWANPGQWALQSELHLTPAEGASDLSFSQDGTSLAASTNLHGVRVYQEDTGQPGEPWSLRQTLKGFRQPPFIALSASGDLVTADRLSGKVRVWNWRTGELKKSTQLPLSGYGAFSPDGSRLAYGNIDSSGVNHVKVFDLGTFSEVLDLSGAVGPIEFSPDGSTIAAGSKENILLWNASNGTLIATLQRPDWQHFDTSPEGQRVNGVDEALFGHKNDGNLLNALSFSRDGSHLATASKQGTICIWKAAPEGK
jgi:WD40 repeat protein